MKVCQSCGMPMSKDIAGGGTEADGSKSETYCSLCYADGEFYLKDVSAKEMQAFCVDAMAKNGTPRIIAWVLIRGIPKLSRWQAA